MSSPAIRTWALAPCIAFGTGAAQPAAHEFTDFRGKYLGQKPPGVKAVRFGEGFFGPNCYTSVVFSRDGQEAYWSTQGQMYFSRQIEGRWIKPQPLNIHTGKAVSPMLSVDERRIYFQEWAVGGKLFYCERTGEGWSKPVRLPESINATPNIHWNVSLDRRNNLYFAFGKSNTDVKILFSEYQKGNYSTPTTIDKIKEYPTICPFISPEGDYLIYVKGMPTENDKSNKAFFILFKTKSNQWSQEINISEIIGKNGFCPHVSADGKYLFFTADKGSMYWVDASFIQELKRKVQP